MGKKKQAKQQSDPQQQIDYDDSEEGPKSKKTKKTKKNAPSKPKKQAEDQPPSQKPKNKPAKPKKKPSKLDNDQEEQEKDEKVDKKKDFLPGQKHQTPEEDDGARAFYTSLYAQKPTSEIAKRYCLQYGLLERDDAIRIQKQLSKKKEK